MGPYPPHLHPSWQRPPPPPKPETHGRAVASLCLGLLAMGGLGGAAGIPAIILGSMARREIDRANGALSGKAVAAGGIVAGLFGTGFGFVLLLWAAGSILAPNASPDTTAAVPMPTIMVPADDDDSPPPMLAPVMAGTRTFGSLEVVDLDQSRPLRGQLAEVIAHAKGRTVILQTYVTGSRECDDISAAFTDGRMQSALANVTLVRVDVDEYKRDLDRMHVDTKTAPWFYKLDKKAQPVDAISAAEWDENIPENMAPKLGPFVKRR